VTCRDEELSAFLFAQKMAYFKEQCMCIKFCFKLGTTAVETYTLLLLAFERKHHAELTQVVSTVQQCCLVLKTLMFGVLFFDINGIMHCESTFVHLSSTLCTRRCAMKVSREMVHSKLISLSQ
jgi:hypothetical protein